MPARCESLFQMLPNPLRRLHPVVALFAFLSLPSVCLQGESPDALPQKTTGPLRADTTAWKRYRNETWGYCVSYPSRWYKGDAFEGSGLFVETGAKKFSKPTGEIDVAAVSNPAENASPAALTLVSDFQAHLDGLRKFERAERMEVLEQHPIDLLGSSALFTRDRYYDPLERATWIEEIVFAKRKNVLYRLELECRADQMSRFGPVFVRVMQTFEFDCRSRH